MDNSLNSYKNYLLKVAFNNLPYAQKYWVEDIVQEAIYKALKNKSEFDENRAKLTSWLATITKNLCIDFIRKKVNQEEKYDSLSFFEKSYEDNKKELPVDVRKYLNKLSYNEQSVIRMKFFFEMTAKEIAPILGVKAGNIPMMYKRALQKLRRLMENDGIDPNSLFTD